MLTKVINLKVYILLIILFFLVSCEESKNQVSQLYDDSFNDDKTKEISCPEVKFIEGLDRLKIKNGGKNVYQLSFYEIKWTCYTSLSLINTIMDNIDLSTSFVVDYNENINNFKEEQFSFIVVLLNEENQIITKEKFNRTFISQSSSEIISNNGGIINIKINNGGDKLYNYRLLLGFTKNNIN